MSLFKCCVAYPDSASQHITQGEIPIVMITLKPLNQYAVQGGMEHVQGLDTILKN